MQKQGKAYLTEQLAVLHQLLQVDAYASMKLYNIFLYPQDVKKYILEDMVRVGKESGLKSFEQVCCL